MVEKDRVSHWVEGNVHEMDEKLASAITRASKREVRARREDGEDENGGEIESEREMAPCEEECRHRECVRKREREREKQAGRKAGCMHVV